MEVSPDTVWHLVTVVIGFIATVTVVKTDISWIKKVVEKHENDIGDLHGRINNIIGSTKQ